MATHKSIVVIGATGMLGRPVVRRLIRDNFQVRALVRDVERARGLLPQGVCFVKGDLRSQKSLNAVIEDMDAVYLSVDTRPGMKFRPETDGLRNVVTALRNHPRTRLLILSALGIAASHAKDRSWRLVREKWDAQEIAKNSGRSWTILEPTWFMESLPLFCRNRTCLSLSGINFSSYWVAGDDLGRIISAALSKDIGRNQIIPVQGQDKLDFQTALERFRIAFNPRFKKKEMPFWMVRAAGLILPPVRELIKLFLMSASSTEPAPDSSIWENFAKPHMNIESYASYCRQTADFPQKY